MSKAHANSPLHQRASLSNSVLIAYLMGVLMIAVLWAGAYGLSNSAQNAPQDVRSCVALKDDVARLACYDNNIAHVASRLPGRGFAP